MSKREEAKEFGPAIRIFPVIPQSDSQSFTHHLSETSIQHDRSSIL
ncbi:hypothetical protein FOXG_21395 [Fusarium oxysporum f. sp. lycopersici 4287]|uniref:Uncharacterized protein n=1 Tax=Fusarium oxysporum f. sp. lycopersici (strain 4287 / CBS 123668 / FGSC 9935 / NRRL 34936) TaxID=426428 RepID=A0A0J9VXV9_FUSO4|nr:hypothetical protein FOXG_20904 [Fusarium oxysporum f. sp. lycopersici 4287]XP_018253646.1 hypothetical protein FOXG_21395 [Fusarium oxysporum f. sp. lycopersici 4287]EWZ78375.1 hypothetical protein FOWG_17347 [Fusarium oxysporum f. sp. lycopersici MN25]KNB13735.1 hypothetical protein FOXG_20904 [Fusarium oxysporum f. sp. lycopersici 4287]KNB15601.1 hypothetical protein FOXG_21395 [Fusarium oxysporum f. sp. lycopersici 4287]